jgi:hypothetical protein
MKQRRAEYFDGKECAVEGCHITKDLQLHHKDPAQKFTHRIWSYKKEIRDRELAKCEPRCPEHHVAWHLANSPKHYICKRRK